VYRPGRHFLQIPGPTNVPDRVLRAIDAPTIDHRGPEFAQLGLEVLGGLREVFRTSGPVVVYPASGTGAWEAALVNTLSPGDKVIASETGHFATLWRAMATRLGLDVTWLEGDWRHGADPERIADALQPDTRAVMVVHNETSTGVTSRIADVRAALGDHDALLLVDTISSLASIDYRHDEWGVDVTVGGSQKGLMLPPGLSFNAVSDKALVASKSALGRKLFWSWEEMIANNKNGFFPYTPATNMLYALAEAIDMLHEEGLENVFARHDRHAEATRRAARTWGLEILCKEPRHYSSSLTALMMPAGHDADAFRKAALEHFDISLGTGLSKVAGKVFRIGHLGDTNDLTIIGALGGVEMGLSVAGVPHKKGGVQAAMEYLTAQASPARAAAE
jgi:alanine-glyoxylate transaminase / serine-glyoxylate transaminase / serine-pyruvate transaminase